MAATEGDKPRTQSYVFDNAAPEAEQRFTGLEALYDPVTFRNLNGTGVGTGWQCLEVGAGGGSVARWLAERVAPAGHVLATDLDPQWIPPADRSSLEVRRHDIVRDPLPEAAFDLVHTRLVLIHLPQRQAVLRRLAAALRPGGWLVIEDFDLNLVPRQTLGSDRGDELIDTYFRAIVAVLARRGADPAFARMLPRLLEETGLGDVQAEGHLAFSRGDSSGAQVQRANAEQTRGPLIATGLMTSADIDELCEVFTDPASAFVGPVLISARGRRR